MKLTGLRRLMMVTATLVSLVFTTAACVTNGHDFSSDVSWVQANVTTKERARSLLGEPYSVGNSAGRETWTYGYYRYKLIGKSFQKELKLYWNPDGTVSTYSYNSSFPAETGRQPTVTP